MDKMWKSGPNGPAALSKMSQISDSKPRKKDGILAHKKTIC